MKKRHIDRSTLTIICARRMPLGIEVAATFQAPKTSGDLGHYYAQVTINPSNRSIVSQRMRLRNPKNADQVFQNPRSKDTQRDLALDLVDVFLKTPAWSELLGRVVDPDYRVDASGQQYTVTGNIDARAADTR